jgi:hypothetical protein
VKTAARVEECRTVTTTRCRQAASPGGHKPEAAVKIKARQARDKSKLELF